METKNGINFSGNKTLLIRRKECFLIVTVTFFCSLKATRVHFTLQMQGRIQNDIQMNGFQDI
jgi:hypothetical protein